MKIETLAVVGVGLIGGSVALAARRRGVAARIVGIDHDPEVLQRARRTGLIDEGFTEIETGVARADLVVFCTPVDQIASQVRAAVRVCRPGTLLTDAGSTKVEMLRELADLPDDVLFVGSHPLAGSEKSGSAYADGELFQGRLVLLTPEPRTSPRAVERVRTFWQALGARTDLLSPKEHDQALAYTSHLPHLVASALAGVVPLDWVDLSAGGFRDTTRIAGGSPSLWTAIVQANRPAILAALEQFEEQLGRFRRALEAGDRAGTERLLRQGKQHRDAFPL
jgi:cyclohexadieny/prephenate dehydrogenase